MWKVGWRISLLVLALLTTSVAYADEDDFLKRIDRIECGRINHATVANYRYDFGIDKDQWGTLEIQSLLRRINECFPYDVSSSGDTIANELVHMDKSSASEIDGRRNTEETRASRDPSSTAVYPLNPLNRSRLESDKAPAIAAKTSNQGPRCTGFRNTLNCDPVCHYFFRLENLDFVKPYSGKEISQWEEADFEKLRSDYRSCDLGDSGNFTYDLPPEYIERFIRFLRQARQRAIASAQSIASLPSECRVALSAVTDKDGQLANRLARLQNETQTLFNAGADQEACSKLQEFTDNMQSINETLLQCRTSNNQNRTSPVSSEMFLQSAGVANKLRELATQFGQQKGC